MSPRESGLLCSTVSYTPVPLLLSLFFGFSKIGLISIADCVFRRCGYNNLSHSACASGTVPLSHSEPNSLFPPLGRASVPALTSRSLWGSGCAMHFCLVLLEPSVLKPSLHPLSKRCRHSEARMEGRHAPRLQQDPTCQPRE